jgi:hypothetical protein
LGLLQSWPSPDPLESWEDLLLLLVGLMLLFGLALTLSNMGKALGRVRGPFSLLLLVLVGPFLCLSLMNMGEN